MLKVVKNPAIASLLGTALVVFVVICQGCSQPARGSAGDAARTIEISRSGGDGEPLSNDLLSVGNLTQGGQFEQPIWFRNCSNIAQRITGYSSSCECVTIAGLPVKLAAGASAPVHIGIDLQDERRFTGDVEIVLSLDVEQSEPLPLKVGFTVEAVSEAGGSE